MIPVSQLLATTQRPDDQAVAERDGDILTLGLLRQRVARAVTWLRARQVRRVLLVQDDAFEFLGLLLATLHAGAEAVLPPNAQPGTLAALAPEADLLLRELPQGETTAALAPLDAEAAQLAFFTSGTTGERKRIGKALAQLEREVTTLEALWGEQLGTARVLGMVSHQHIFGLTFRLLWPAMAQRLFAAGNPFAWESLCAGLRQGPAVAVVSPAHLARLEGLPPLPPDQAPRAVFTAGAPLSLAAARQCQALLGVLPTEVFGSTETGGIAWRRQDGEDTPWQALPGVSLAVDDAGLLAIRSPHLATDEAMQTADRAALLPGGFRFTGRADRVVKVEGKRVSLTALEADLTALPEVAAVAPLMCGDVLGAVLVPSAAGRAALEGEGRFRFERRLRRALAPLHEASALPRLWRFVPALPLDALGKRDRPALDALLAEAHPREAIITSLRRGEAGLEIDLALPPGLFWFQGHFPTYPVLPGVVQMHWAIQYARHHLGLEASASGAQVKFRKPIRPWDLLTLTLGWNGRKLAFTYRRDGESCASGSLVLA